MNMFHLSVLGVLHIVSIYMRYVSPIVSTKTDIIVVSYIVTTKIEYYPEFTLTHYIKHHEQECRRAKSYTRISVLYKCINVIWDFSVY